MTVVHTGDEEMIVLVSKIPQSEMLELWDNQKTSVKFVENDLNRLQERIANVQFFDTLKTCPPEKVFETLKGYQDLKNQNHEKENNREQNHEKE